MTERMFATTFDDIRATTAARTPTWGAGSSAALVAAQAAALATMAGRYAGADVAALEKTGRRLAQLADADGPGFAPMLAAWALPADDPGRPAALVEAARTACAVPLHVARLSAQIAAAATEFVLTGQRDVRGDAAAAVHLAGAASATSAALVRLNSRPDRAPDLVAEAEGYAGQARRCVTQVEAALA